MRATDHNGAKIPDGESPDAEILVWQVDPDVTGGEGDYLVMRSYQDMCQIVGDCLGAFLESPDEDELREGVTLTFRLVTMTVREYQELQEAAE